jgi:hypothetical protein
MITVYCLPSDEFHPLSEIEVTFFPNSRYSFPRQEEVEITSFRDSGIQVHDRLPNSVTEVHSIYLYSPPLG